MSESEGAQAPDGGAKDFIRQIVARDIASGKNDGRVVTRFPPEPNGYLHIGHAKSIVLNFGIAQEHPGGRCHLRFDDTNPTKEDLRYVEAIQDDVQWLGFDWGEHLYFASDYFERLFEYAEKLIREGWAYVDSQSEEEIRAGRGSVTEPGRESPYRARSPEESLDLFRRMRAGEFSEGQHVLRARIDMTSPNMLMRDPILYRIRYAEHYRTGDEWCVYPMYDFAHPLGDAIERVTHSLCTMEFENNRELYDWVVEKVEPGGRPRQYEFSRLNLEFMVMSKRKLAHLVREGDVDGWDDPRMPTIAGLRRRGVRPEAIRSFCRMIGVAKADSRVDMGKLEYVIRDDLNQLVPRVLCVVDPLKVVVTNWPEGEEDWLDAPYFPRDVPREGSRKIPFSRELYIERDDFREEPTPGFRRLVPGGEVRLRYGYILKCDEVVRDEAGAVVELRCTVDPGSRGGTAPDGRKIKGTIHWVSARHALPCRVRLYDRLFQVPDPELPEGVAGTGEGTGGSGAGKEGADEPAPEGTGVGRPADGGDEEHSFRRHLNPESLVVRKGAWIEPSVANDPSDIRYQFERLGYFWQDPSDSSRDGLVFNRIVTLQDRWGKAQARRREQEAARAGAGDGTDRDTSSAAAKRSQARDRKTDSEPAAPSGPDLPPHVVEKADALVAELGLGREEAGILAREPELEVFFQAALRAYEGKGGAAPVANWVVHELRPLDEGGEVVEGLPPERVARLVKLVESGVISSRGGKEVLHVMVRDGGDPDRIVERLDLTQVTDEEALRSLVEEVLAAHPDKVAAYRSGRTGLLGFFMGELMRLSQGKADPESSKRFLREELG